ncbi:MAG: lipopolysaccharide biosynthesis protein [Saprospiraceae bacterium]|nr:lipopolysaccharide biosynthesis protein [Saprospiraceae bacterium]
MLFYSLLGFVRPALAIILIPIYLNVFTESEWAVYSLMLVVGGFSMILMTFRLNAAMLTKYYDYFHDRLQLRKYLSTLFTSSIGISIVTLALAYFTGEAIFDYVFESEELLFFPYGFTIIVYAALGEINQSYFTFLRNEKNLKRYALVILTQVLLVIIFQFVLIVILRKGVQGAIVGMLLSNIITFILILFLERDILKYRPDWGMLRSSLKFSIPLIPYLLIYWFMTKGERIVLEQFLDLELVGKYILLVTITGVTIMLIEAVINGVRPFLFEVFKRDNLQEASTIRLLTGLIVNVPLFIIPLVIFLGNNLQLITTNEAYYVIAPYTGVGVLVAYSIVYAKLFYQQLVFTKKSSTVTALSFVSMTVFIFSLIYFIPKMEIWGVLIAVAIANLTQGLLFYISGQKHLKIQFSWRSIALNPLLVCIVVIACEWYVAYSGISRSLYGIIALLGMTSLIYSINRYKIRQYKAIFLNSELN